MGPSPLSRFGRAEKGICDANLMIIPLAPIEGEERKVWGEGEADSIKTCYPLIP